uniref:Uncharacterized protein n=1 Tax=Lepeophtheirus salmonis TaxID=72036 RepID=A0A0K2SV35_LEPSM
MGGLNGCRRLLWHIITLRDTNPNTERRATDMERSKVEKIGYCLPVWAGAGEGRTFFLFSFIVLEGVVELVLLVVVVVVTNFRSLREECSSNSHDSR